jgi:hypothetical protein
LDEPHGAGRSFGITVGVPQIAAHLLQRPKSQPWANKRDTTKTAIPDRLRHRPDAHHADPAIVHYDGTPITARFIAKVIGALKVRTIPIPELWAAAIVMPLYAWR